MINKVRDTISRYNMFSIGDNVIVALSGGADSVSLFNVLLKLQNELGITVSAAHLNHNIRGAEADRDEAFCRKLCENLGVTLFVKSVDIPALSKERGESEELCGRNERYAFFHSLALNENSKIATAHTLSDCEETMLYNIARGTSPYGLVSIPHKRQNILRPLLDVTREEIEEYALENALEYVTDSTNFLEETSKRNKIRLSVLPPLKSTNDGFHQNFKRLRSMLQSLDGFMTKTALQLLEKARCDFGLRGDILSESDEAVLMKALSIWLDSEDVRYEYKHIDFIISMLKSSGALELPDRVTVVYKQGVLRLRYNDKTEDFCEMPFEKNVLLCYQGKKYSFKEISATEEINKKLADNSLDCDKIPLDAVIRTRREGDTFSIPGRKITKSLRKLQNELKIPAEKRDNALLIASGSEVLWAEYIGVSNIASCSKDTKIIISPSIGKDG